MHDDSLNNLICKLASQIPPMPPVEVKELDFGIKEVPDEPDGPINAELRRLLMAIQNEPMDERTAMTAIGRMRHLYPQGSHARSFSDSLIDVLRQIVERFPKLKDSPKYIRPAPGCYMRVGGLDPRTSKGYPAQHKTRFVDCFIREAHRQISVPNQALQRTAATLLVCQVRKVAAVAAAAELGCSAREGLKIC